MTHSPLLAADRLFLDDLSVGQTFISRTHPLGVAEIRSFATEFDPQPFHLDESAAEAAFFSGLTASGWHTAAITMRLMVETVPLAGGLIGVGGELLWPSPARPGDDLKVHCEVLEIMPSRTRPERGSVKLCISTRNQRGEEVQRFTVKVIVARRAASGT